MIGRDTKRSRQGERSEAASNREASLHAQGGDEDKVGCEINQLSPLPPAHWAVKPKGKLWLWRVGRGGRYLRGPSVHPMKAVKTYGVKFMSSFLPWSRVHPLTSSSVSPAAVLAQKPRPRETNLEVVCLSA